MKFMILITQCWLLIFNMAIVSVHRILTTRDRIVLEQEHQNIINNLSLGNIESDKDMTILYRNLLEIISRRRLREEDREFLRGRYDRMEQKLLKSTLGDIKSSGGNILTLVGRLAVSCVSLYFSYKYSRSELAEGLSGELWQLTKEDITDCNALQERLLSSSWKLLRKHKRPDSELLTQKKLNDFYKAVNEQNLAKRLRMLRALEKDFQVYPPYWYYRGKTAQKLSNINEAHSCFERFNEVWRPVLRQDPYKVEALKFRLSEIIKGGNLSGEEKREAINLLEVMTENTPSEDWANRIFAAVAYFVLGEKNIGIEIVQSNVDFGYGVDTSRIILTQLKSDKLSLETLSSELAGLLKEEAKDKKLAELRKKAAQDDARAQLDLGLKYSYYGNDKEAAKWFHKAAEQGQLKAQFIMGSMYENGQGVEQSYKTAYVWYYLAYFGGFDCISRVNQLEKKEHWLSKPKVSPIEAKEAKAEAKRKYDEIMKRNSLD